MHHYFAAPLIIPFVDYDMNAFVLEPPLLHLFFILGFQQVAFIVVFQTFI